MKKIKIQLLLISLLIVFPLCLIAQDGLFGTSITIQQIIAYIKLNWVEICVIGTAMIEIILRVYPSAKNNSLLMLIENILSWLLASRRKGGGKFDTYKSKNNIKNIQYMELTSERSANDHVRNELLKEFGKNASDTEINQVVNSVGVKIHRTIQVAKKDKVIDTNKFLIDKIKDC